MNHPLDRYTIRFEQFLSTRMYPDRATPPGVRLWEFEEVRPRDGSWGFINVLGTDIHLAHGDVIVYVGAAPIRVIKYFDAEHTVWKWWLDGAD